MEESTTRYLGGIVAFGGLCISGAFAGRWTAPPLAATYVDLSPALRILGTLFGFAVVAAGLALLKRADATLE